MTKEDVLKIKAIIDENKTKKIKTETKLEASYKYAKEEFGCETIEDIEKELDSMDKNIENLEDQINEGTKALEEAYDWAI